MKMVVDKKAGSRFFYFSLMEEQLFPHLCVIEILCFVALAYGKGYRSRHLMIEVVSARSRRPI